MSWLFRRHNATKNLEVNSSPPRRVIIIGGGLGGLTLCQALRGSNIDVKVFERDETGQSREQGYYIGVNDTGAEALSKLDHPELRDILTEQKVTGFTVIDNKFNLLAELAWDPPKKPDSVPPGLVNRVILRECLTHGIEDNIVWNKRFVRYQEFPDRVVALFEDGTSVEGDLLVGADGVNSKVRAQRCPELKTEGVNISTFAAMIKSPDESQIPTLMRFLSSGMLRILGPAGYTLLVGLIVVNDTKRLFWAFSHPTNNDQKPKDEISQRKLYEEISLMFHPEVQKLIRMPSQIIMFRELQAIKPLPYNPLGKESSRVTLLGDAAHAMTTHRGQGANTTFLDAIDLANAIKSGCLVEYEKILFKRGFRAVIESRQSTNAIHASGFMAYIVWMMFYFIGTIVWIRKKLKL